MSGGVQVRDGRSDGDDAGGSGAVSPGEKNWVGIFETRFVVEAKTEEEAQARMRDHLLQTLTPEHFTVWPE